MAYTMNMSVKLLPWIKPMSTVPSDKACVRCHFEIESFRWTEGYQYCQICAIIKESSDSWEKAYWEPVLCVHCKKEVEPLRVSGIQAQVCGACATKGLSHDSLLAYGDPQRDLNHTAKPRRKEVKTTYSKTYSSKKYQNYFSPPALKIFERAPVIKSAIQKTVIEDAPSPQAQKVSVDGE